MTFCSHCGSSVKENASFCNSCGKPLDGSLPAISPTTESGLAEHTLFNRDGITVTDSRFIVGGQTFSLGNIASVERTVTQPSRKGPIITIIIGILALSGSAGRGFPVGTVVVALTIIAIGVIILMRRKPDYWVTISTSAGQRNRMLPSKNRDFIDSVVNAINEAMVFKRGRAA